MIMNCQENSLPVHLGSSCGRLIAMVTRMHISKPDSEKVWKHRCAILCPLRVFWQFLI